MTELRADARRNREELLDVAREVIREQGVDASLRDIARRAGVGIATLYRHFPTRDALITAIIGDGMQRMNARAAELSQALPPGEALGSGSPTSPAGSAPTRACLPRCSTR